MSGGAKSSAGAFCNSPAGMMLTALADLNTSRGSALTASRGTTSAPGGTATPGTLTDTGGQGGYGAQQGKQGTGVSGPMSATERATCNSLLGGLGYGNLAASLAGYGVPGLGVATTATRGLFGGLSALADFLGVPTTVNPTFGYSPTDIQGIRDMFGEFAADAAAQAGKAAETAYGQSIMGGSIFGNSDAPGPDGLGGATAGDNPGGPGADDGSGQSL